MMVRGLPLLVALAGCLDAPPSSVGDGGLPLDGDASGVADGIPCEEPADCPGTGSGRECYCGSCAVHDLDCGPNQVRWLLSDGTDGECATVPIDVAVGYQSSCVLWSNGLLSCWGGDCFGEIGDGGAIDCADGPQFSPVPRLVRSSTDGPPFDDAVAVAVGFHHACAIRRGGAVWCWGSNGSGKLGDGSAEVNAPTPVQVITAPDVPLSGIIAIAAGNDHTCALDAEGYVYCWGNNDYRQLGVSTIGDRDVATLSTIGTDFVRIAAGAWHSCVSRPGASTDELFCWGRGSFGQIGDNASHEPGSNDALPVRYESNPDVMLVPTIFGLGENFSCSATAGPGAWCWGSNVRHALGDVAAPTTLDGQDALSARRTSHVLSSAPTHLAGGTSFACMRLEDRTLTCWGANQAGQLGIGEATTNPSGPTAVELDTVDIDAGDDHVCAITPARTVVCWGGNAQGQLGDGSNSAHAEPAEVISLCL